MKQSQYDHYLNWLADFKNENLKGEQSYSSDITRRKRILTEERVFSTGRKKKWIKLN